MARMCRRHSRWTNMPAYRAGSPCPSSRPISERAIRASSNRPLLITSCHATTGERHVQRSHLSLLLHGCVADDRPRALSRKTRTDRKSVVSGQSVSVRVDPGGRRIIKKKKNQEHSRTLTQCTPHNNKQQKHSYHKQDKQY